MMTKKEIDDAGKAEYAKWRADKDKSNFLKAQNMVADAGALELLRYGDGGALADKIERDTKRKMKENGERYKRGVELVTTKDNIVFELPIGTDPNGAEAQRIVNAERAKRRNNK